jgi:hypothetical protein
VLKIASRSSIQALFESPLFILALFYCLHCLPSAIYIKARWPSGMLDQIIVIVHCSLPPHFCFRCRLHQNQQNLNPTTTSIRFNDTSKSINHAYFREGHLRARGGIQRATEALRPQDWRSTSIACRREEAACRCAISAVGEHRHASPKT